MNRRGENWPLSQELFISANEEMSILEAEEMRTKPRPETEAERHDVTVSAKPCQ